jgi:uncharacterized Zn finger protein (UPF0148 family)
MFNYHCFNTENRKECESCSNNGQVLIEEQGEFVCPCNGSSLKLIGEINGSAAIKTPTINRMSEASRKKRNKEHFIKNDLPTITDKDAKRHHLNKLGYKNL